MKRNLNDMCKDGWNWINLNPNGYEMKLIKHFKNYYGIKLSSLNIHFIHTKRIQKLSYP